ncbi:MAG: thioredoxin family protein [Chitinivibrionales bacterium]|nr:thioredoxin family protein [Chitinivibrionales bacterium]
MKEVKVLGTGCPKCKKLAEMIELVARENGFEINLEKVTDMNKIVSYGVMMTPGLVIDGEVKTSGKAPNPDELKEMLQ